MLIMYVSWKVLKKTKFVKLDEMDLVTDTYPAEPEKPRNNRWNNKAKRVFNWIL